jgi:hypothetical protein
MELKCLTHPGIRTRHWVAQNMIRNEWCRWHKQAPDSYWVHNHNPRLDVICEAYRLICKWPWLLGLLEESPEGLSKRLGLSHTAIPRRINRIRARLGLAQRYRK